MSATKVKIGFIGGSGLNNPQILENAKEVAVDTPYGSPSDVLISGTIKGVDCVILARHGRQHTINPSNVNYRANIWALKSVGCTHVIVSTATGSLQEDIQPGDLVILDSFIDRTRTRIQTFYDGSEMSPAGVVHIPMEPAFSNSTRQVIIDSLKELGFKSHNKGTAVCIEGPRFSSLAESNVFKSWNAQLVNMTLVPEVVLAKEAGLLYAAVAMATDYDCWRDVGNKVCVADVLKTFKENVEKITKLFVHIVPKIAAQDWTKEIEELKTLVESSNMAPRKS
uniref:S-methyl-5'-thioadenosine phosphorylase n=1 Tax=Cacopsylla melanoneura TaxID=428564 RepID=A0A8D8QBT9_9HEMI